MDLAEVFFGESSLQKTYRREIEEIRRGERRTPNPDPPETIEGGARPFLSDDDRAIFSDFEGFSAALNADMEGTGWLIDDLPDVDIGDFSGPAWGRKYVVYFNNVRLGKFAIGADLLWKIRGGPPVARCDIELDYVQFLPFDTLFSFLRTTFLYVHDDVPNSVPTIEARLDHLLLRHLWDCNADPHYMSTLNVDVHGSYEFYMQRHSAFQAKATRTPESE